MFLSKSLILALTTTATLFGSAAALADGGPPQVGAVIDLSKGAVERKNDTAEVSMRTRPG